MHCYLQKVELISHWTEAGSQRIIQCKSRYNYFQAVFWVLGLTKPLTESLATIPLSETFGPKTSYLQSALPRAPTSSTFPVKPIRCVTAQAGTPKRIYPAPKRWQPGAGCPQKKQLIFYLFWFSVMELSPGKRRGASRLNSQWFSFPRVYTFCMQYCICAQDVILQQGRTAASGPSLPSQ